MSTHLKYWLFVAALLLPFSSCNPQKRVVREAVARFQAPAVLLLIPDFIFKSNLKPLDTPAWDQLSADQQDSARYFSSRFLRHANDSLLLPLFAETLEQELKSYGFRVYREPQLDTFLLLGEPAWVLSLAQAELEENIEIVTDSYVFDDTLEYYKDFQLNLLRFNHWFEVSRLNSVEQKPVVLFASFFMQDQLKGRFKRHPLLLDVKYKYELLELRTEDIAGLITHSARKEASYFYDYLLNTVQLPKYQGFADSTVYWHYNRLSRNVYPAGENRFTSLE